MRVRARDTWRLFWKLATLRAMVSIAAARALVWVAHVLIARESEASSQRAADACRRATRPRYQRAQRASRR